MHGYDFDMMPGWGGMWFGPVVMFLIFVALVVVVVWLFRAAAGSGSSSRGGAVIRNSNAREVLDERYAKGEIDDEEYQRRRSAIES